MSTLDGQAKEASAAFFSDTFKLIKIECYIIIITRKSNGWNHSKSSKNHFGKWAYLELWPLDTDLCVSADVTEPKNELSLDAVRKDWVEKCMSLSFSFWQFSRTTDHVPNIYRKYPTRLYRLSAEWTKRASKRKSTRLCSFKMRLVMAGRKTERNLSQQVVYTALEKEPTRVSRMYRSTRGLQRENAKRS